VRKRFNGEVFSMFVEALSEQSKICKSLMSHFDRSMEAVDSEGKAVEKPQIPVNVLKFCLPEAECMIATIAVTHFIDSKKVDVATNVTRSMVQRITTFNRRSMDKLSSNAYFFYARCAELNGSLSSIRKEMLDAYRTACLHMNYPGQATLINILLRDYLSCNLVDQAFKFVSKTTFPEQRSNAQYARYLYYVGRIKAIQLEYTDAHNTLTHAVRKAPSNSCRGFRLASTKLSIIVELLTGEIPDRDLFNQHDLRDGLKPYFQLTQAVRSGDLNEFQKVFEKHIDLFHKDKTYSLILRLSQNVIKAGLRSVATSYSQISFDDIRKKLGLNSNEEAEFVIAKAVSDGVIDARIDREAECMLSQRQADLYCSSEPQKQLHKRIAFSLSLHNDLLKAMQYPDKSATNKFAATDEMDQEEMLAALEAEMDEDDDM